ncbi:unnamed protein product, partial [Chrysoparadoxa australica]
EKARELAKESILMRGKAPLMDTKIIEVEELGVGMVIYFKIVHRVAWVFTVMSLIAFPAILVNRYGNDGLGENLDQIQVLSFTLGNLNFWDKNGNMCIHGSKCRTPLPLVSSGASSEAVLILNVVTDLLCCLVFVGLISHLLWMIGDTVKTSKQACQASNYAIMVKGLPKDAKEAEIAKHFSDHFDMTKVLEKRSSRRGSLLTRLAQDAQRRGSWMLGISGQPQAMPQSPEYAKSRSPMPKKPSPQEILRRLRQPTPVVDCTFP